MFDFAQARRTMVDSQLRTFDVNDIPLLDAFETVPRELFMPKGREEAAYIDQDIPLSPDRFMLAPMVQARMIQTLAISSGDRVLDVACGLGYSCAVLHALGAAVTGLESDPDLADSAKERLLAAGIQSASLAVGPLDEGCAKFAPFDAILINGAVETGLDPLLAQLAEGGRLVCVMGGGRAGKATLFVRSGEAFGSRSVFGAAAPLLSEFRKKPSFVF